MSSTFSAESEASALDSKEPGCGQSPSAKSNRIQGQSSPNTGLESQSLKMSESWQLPMFTGSMSFAADSHVRTSLLPAVGQGSTGKGLDYGQSTPVLLAKYDPATSSWRTSQHCLEGGLEEFLETWPRSGSMLNGIAYRLPPLAPRKDETDSGLWPTPDTRGFVNEGSVAMLAKKCRTWQEYSAMAYRCAEGKKKKYWKGEITDSPIIGRLNPAWVEWLMGYPEGHSDCTDWETRSSRKSPNSLAAQSSNTKES